MKKLTTIVANHIKDTLRIDDTLPRKPAGRNMVAYPYIATVKLWANCYAVSQEDASNQLLREMTHQITLLLEDIDVPRNVPDPKAGSRWYRDCGNPYAPNGYTVLFITNTENVSDKHPPQVVYQGDNGKMWSLDLNRWPGNLVPERLI
jgi:hypothetical protein